AGSTDLLRIPSKTAAAPFLKIRAPRGSERVCVPADEDVPPDWQGARRKQMDFPLPPVDPLFVPVNTHRRPPRAGKYLSLTHRRPLLGCRRMAQRHNAFQISESTYAKTALLTTRR